MRSELKVLSARAVKSAVSAIAGDFSRATGCRTTFDFAPVGTLEDRIAAGETADVVVLSERSIDRLVLSNRVTKESVRKLGCMSIGVAVSKGAPTPDISTPEAFRALLSAARAISVSDPSIGGTSALYLPKLFDRLGMTTELEPKLRRQKGGGGDVAECVARGEAEIGITFISEILPIAGVTVAGPLPAEYGNDTVYCAAQFAGAANPDAAALIAQFTAASSRPVWAAAGFSAPDRS
jgi:molybdate transport system substrate-binding protein